MTHQERDSTITRIRHSRYARLIMEGGQDAVRAERLLLAAKAAVAASIAWLLAPFVPFAASEYSYYAPLGVLVSMYPTVAGSVRAGVQALVGLGIGILLGLGSLALVQLGAPALLAIALTIGLGILIGGVTTLGAGREWVAIAALFVLLLGGGDTGEFTLSYLLTMAFGVLVGITMNLLVIPPLYLRRASSRLTLLRDAVCVSLHDVAEALVEHTIDADRLRQATDDLGPLFSRVAGDVDEADESSRGNPRGRRKRGDRDLNGRRMRALDRTTRATHELSETLAHAAEEGTVPDERIRATLAEAVHAAADLVAAPTGDDAAGERLVTAGRALDHALTELDRAGADAVASRYGRAYAFAAAICVRRIIDASTEFVDTDPERS